jgi:hypothetical protein
MRGATFSSFSTLAAVIAFVLRLATQSQVNHLIYFESADLCSAARILVFHACSMNSTALPFHSCTY